MNYLHFLLLPPFAVSCSLKVLEREGQRNLRDLIKIAWLHIPLVHPLPWKDKPDEKQVTSQPAIIHGTCFQLLLSCFITHR